MMNKYGKCWNTHFDLKLLNQMHRLHQKLGLNLPSYLKFWNNTDQYGGSEFSRSGFAELHPNTRTEMGWGPYSLTKPQSMLAWHEIVAFHQNVEIAVIPISNKDEMREFKVLISELRQQSPEGSIDWYKMAKAWQSKVHGSTIFPKLLEHLSSWYTAWSKARAGSTSVLAAGESRKGSCRNKPIIMLPWSRQSIIQCQFIMQKWVSRWQHPFY